MYIRMYVEKQMYLGIFRPRDRAYKHTRREREREREREGEVVFGHFESQHEV